MRQVCRDEGTQHRQEEGANGRDGEGNSTAQAQEGENEIVPFHRDDYHGIPTNPESGQENIQKPDGKERVGDIHPHRIDMLADSL